MQKNRDCTEESGRTSVDTKSLSFGAALLWRFAGCLLWEAPCDVTLAEAQSTLLLETSASSSGVSSLPSAPASVKPMQLRWRSNGGSQVLTRIHSQGVSNTSLEGVDSLSGSLPVRSLDS
jgi:hypothetical protein